MTTPTLRELEERALAIVTAVSNDPEGRYRLREDFYEKFGHGSILDPAGFGASELAFLRWEIDRGALDPTTGTSPGSPWWRRVNSDFLYFSTLAGLIAEAGLVDPDVGDEVAFWLDYIAKPGARLWYRAHNRSIVRGYLGAIAEAKAESASEQLFMNEVLYRLLFAEAMEMGKAFGTLGRIAADPRLPAVDVMVHIPAFYPTHYPLTPADVINVEHLGEGLEADLEDLLDEAIILPHITSLYALVAGTIDMPALERLIKDGQPVYPDLSRVPQAAIHAAMQASASARAKALGAPPPPLRTGPPPQKKRVLILGGGMAGLTAAHELTSAQGWQDEYDVTLLQLGWRAGGKTTTGRGKNARIEEHGIHILQGWYENTFRLLADVYDERRALHLDPESPFQTWQSAMQANDSTLLTEWMPDRGWVNWPWIFPPNEAVPGQGPPLSFWQLAKKLIAMVLELVLGSPYMADIGPIAKWILDFFFPPDGAPPPGLPDPQRHQHWFQIVGAPPSDPDEIERVVRAGLGRVVDALHTESDDVARAAARETLQRVMERMRAYFTQTQSGGQGTLGDRIRRIVMLLEFAYVNAVGVFEDVWDPKSGKFNWSNIDGQDYRAWIASHGASADLLSFVIVRFLYTGTFANLAGGSLNGGLVAAGTALRFLVESAGYKGSFVYQFRAGTGDTMVMPLYEVLAARGVKFEFFQDVRSVVPGDGTITQIVVDEQVTLTVPAYDPTRHVGHVRAWPSHPRYDQIDPKQAAALRDGHVDLESPWADWTCPATKTLNAGTDFDVVVLAIPIAALPRSCPEIFAQNRTWQNMLANVGTTATQSVQLWLAPNLSGLGMNLADWGLGQENCAPNVVVYESPLYSWLDQTLVLPQERWPADRAPQTIAYYTGSLPDPAVVPPYTDHGYPEREQRALATRMRQWLWDSMGFFWPAGARLEAPNGLDPALLVGATDEDTTPDAKYASQFFHAAVNPSDRYTLSLPKSATFRLKANASGYSNMVLAGDWIDFGMNVGYIEGAIISGLQAAAAARACLKLSSKSRVIERAHV